MFKMPMVEKHFIEKHTTGQDFFMMCKMGELDWMDKLYL